MPWEVHSRSRLREKPAPYDESSMPTIAEFVRASSSDEDEDVEEQWPPFYRYDYDLESLWWILLWACLFCVPHQPAQDLGARIFTHTLVPSQERTNVMQTPRSKKIQRYLPPQLKRLVPVIHALHAWLHRSYASVPGDVDGYLTEIHRPFWHILDQMQKCVDEIGDITLSDLSDR